MKKLLVVIGIVVVAAGAYAAGYTKAMREHRLTSLAQALATTTLTANTLNSLAADRQPLATKLLVWHLRSSITEAERAVAAGGDVPVSIPNLVDGLRRANVYAERIGDAELSRRLTALHARLDPSVCGGSAAALG